MPKSKTIENKLNQTLKQDTSRAALIQAQAAMGITSLEPRILLDAAAVVTGAEALTDALTQDQTDTALAALIGEGDSVNSSNNFDVASEDAVLSEQDLKALAPMAIELNTVKLAEAIADDQQTNNIILDDIVAFSTSSIVAAPPGELIEVTRFNGQVDVAVTGGSFRAASDDVDPTLLNLTASGVIDLPDGVSADNIISARLFWAGSGGPNVDVPADNQVTLNGIDVFAELTFTDEFDGNEQFFGASADVTDIIRDFGEGIFTVGDLQVDTGGNFATFTTVTAGFTLSVVYEDSSITTDQTVVLLEGLDAIFGGTTSQINATSDIVIPNLDITNSAPGVGPQGRVITSVFEGDPGIGGPQETILINGTNVTPDGAFDSVSNLAGVNDGSQSFGVDIDEFSIENLVSDGDTQIDLSVSTGGDFVNVGPVALVFTNDGVPDAVNDSFDTTTDTALNITAANGVLANDVADQNSPITVTEINGTAVNIGQEITLASGALVTLNADGSFDYDPNGAFDGLASGAATIDGFTYTVVSGVGTDSASVTINVTAPTDTDGDGVADLIDVDDDNDGILDVDEGFTSTLGTFGTEIPDDADEIFEITANNNAQELAEFLFTPNSPVTVSNAVLSQGDGSVAQVGTFDDADRITDQNGNQNAFADFSAGIILSTGAVEEFDDVLENRFHGDGNPGFNPALGDGTNGTGAAGGGFDADFASQNGTFDVASLSFDISVETESTLVGRFVFASEEFSDFINSGFNDLARIFVNGTNLALTPNGAELSIDTINNNTQSEFFVDNETNPDAVNIEADGFTTVLTFTATLNAGFNTIELGVADDGDAFFDSVLLFNANSFVVVPNITEIDTDSDGVSDHLDIDSDNDGITDNIEAQTTNGFIAPSGVGGTSSFTDVNMDGLDDVFDNRTDLDADSAAATTLEALINPVDTDNDGDADFVDTNSDNEGGNDTEEAGLIGTAIGLSTDANDSDGDGLFDVFDTQNQTTADDGFDVNESLASGAAALPDTDGDASGGVPLEQDVDFRDTINMAAPIAQDDSFTIHENPEGAEIGVITNGNLLADNGGGLDSDADNDPLTVTQINGVDIMDGEQITLASGALLTINTDGTFDYDPNGAFDSLDTGEAGIETFTYTLSDGTSSDTDTATVTITISGDNDIPIIDLNGPDIEGVDFADVFVEDELGQPLANLLSFDAVVEDDEDNIAQVTIIPTLPEPNDGADEFLRIDSSGIDLSIRLSDGEITANTPLVFGNTTFDVAYVNGEIIITNAASDSDTFESDDLEGFLRLLAFQNVNQDNTNGPREFDFQVTDPAGVTIATSTITVNSVNDAPVPVINAQSDGTIVEAGGEAPTPILIIDPTTRADVAALTGDEVRDAIANGASASDLGLISVADLLAQLDITDAEDAEFAIGVIFADETQGRFQYVRTADGFEDHEFTDFQLNDEGNLDATPVPDGEALLLASDTYIRFLADPGFDGAAGFEFRVSDLSVGTPSNPPSTIVDDSGGVAPTNISSLSTASFSVSLAADTDGDGIINADDIDDDNDGILDVDEGLSTDIFSPDSATLTRGGVDSDVAGVETSLQVNDVIRYGNSVIIDGQSIDVLLTILEIGNLDANGEILLNANSNPTIFVNENVNQDPFVRYSIELVESGTNTAVTLQNPTSLLISDVDSGTGVDISEVFGVQTGAALSVELGEFVASGNFVNGGSVPSGFDYFTVDPTDFGDPTDFTDEDNTPATSSDSDINIAFDNFSSVEFVLGSTGTFSGNSGTNRGFRVLDFTVVNDRDTDSDGIADHLDIDSDNDGITDTVEAQTTAGLIAPSGTGNPDIGGDFIDVNRDGLDDNFDAGVIAGGAANGVGFTPVDTDSDGTDDVLDTDSDDDGILDVAERGDGGPTAFTAGDADGDGLADVFEGTAINDGFDVNDENIAGDDGGLDGSFTGFNLVGVPALNADGSNAVPLDTDLSFRDVENAPVAENNATTTNEDNLIAVSGNIITDIDPTDGVDSDLDGDTLTITDIDGNAVAPSGTTDIVGQYGTLTIAPDGTYSYNVDTTNATVQALGNSETLVESFTYTLSDGTSVDTADLNITINGSNDAPVAQDDSETTDEDTVLSDNVLLDNGAGADSDPESDPLTVTAVNGNALDIGSEITLPSGATLTLNADGTYDYDPNEAFEDLTVGESITDSFTYDVSDGNGGVDTATVTIVINGVNDAPIAEDDGLSTTENETLLTELFLDNGNGLDRDIDGDTIIVTRVLSGDDEAALTALTDGTNIGSVISGSMGGLFTVLSNGTVNFDPGADFDDLAVGESRTTQIVYQIDDGNGGTDRAVVTVTVNGENDSIVPVIPGDPNDPLDRTDFLPEQMGVDSSPITDLDLTEFFSDPDASDVVTLTIDPADLPPGLSFDGTTLSGTPDANASVGGDNGDGVYIIPVTVTDSNGDSFVTELVYTITNPAPVAEDDGFTTAEDTPVSGELLGNDSDPDGDDLVVDAVALADGTIVPVGVATDIPEGTLTVNADGTFTFDPVLNFNGPVTFGYTVSDGQGGTDVATVTIDVTPVNDTPIVDGILPAQTGLDSDAITDLDVSSVFSDLDGDPLTFSASNLPDGLVIDPDTGVISGTPAPDASQDGDANDGVYTVTLTATDPDGDTVSTDVTFTITNPAPVAEDDAAVVSEDGPVATGNVILENDVDVDGDDLSVSEVGGDSANVGTAVAGDNGGLFTINPDGTYSFDPNGEFEALDIGESATTSITYQISDGEGGFDTATLTVTIDGENDAPTPVDPTDVRLAQSGADSDTLTPLDASELFSDPDVEVNFFNLDGAPDFLSIDPFTGLITGTPPADASVGGPNSDGIYEVIVIATDPDGATNSVTVTYTITNPAPVAEDDAAVVSEDGPVATGNVILENDVDPDGDDLTVSEVGGDSANVGTSVAGDNGGLFTINSDGTYSFDANGDFEGLDEGEDATTSITYQISDGEGGFDTATLTVTVDGVNDAPVVVDPSGNGNADPIPAQTGEDSAALTPLDTSVFFDDVDAEPLTFTATNLPSGLVIDPVTGVISGTPDSDASQGGDNGDGTYTVTITTADPDGDTVSTDVSFTITNPAPVAEGDGFTTAEDTPVSGELLGNDSDPDGDDLVVDAVALADGTIVPIGVATDIPEGTLTVNADGTFTFDPVLNFNGPVTFGYTVSDGQGGTDVATVTIDVTPVNDAPIPVDPTQPSVDPQDIIDPTDPDDPREPPLDPNDFIPEQSGEDGQPIVPLDLTPFFGDPDVGDEVTLSIDPVDLPSGLSFDPVTGTISGTPDSDASQGGPNADGVYEVAVTATDPSGQSFTTIVTFDISNPPPVAVDDGPLDVLEDTPTVLDILGNDADPDGDDLILTEINGVSVAPGDIIILPSGATLEVNADGRVTYTPIENSNAPDSFTYTISDGEGGFDTAIVEINIIPVNDAPNVTDGEGPNDGNGAPTTTGAALPARVNTDGEEIAPVDVSVAFEDIDGDNLTFSAEGLPTGLMIDPVTGLITGTLDNSASVDGPYNVTITATDPDGELISTTFVWTVNNIAPEVTQSLPSVNLTTVDTANIPTATAFTDPDADDLTFSANGLPEGLSIDPDTGVISGVTTEEGVFTVTIIADDGEGGQVETTLILDVLQNGFVDVDPDPNSVELGGPDGYEWLDAQSIDLREFFEAQSLRQDIFGGDQLTGLDYSPYLGGVTASKISGFGSDDAYLLVEAVVQDHSVYVQLTSTLEPFHDVKVQSWDVRLGSGQSLPDGVRLQGDMIYIDRTVERESVDLRVRARLDNGQAATMRVSIDLATGTVSETGSASLAQASFTDQLAMSEEGLSVETDKLIKALA